MGRAGRKLHRLVWLVPGIALVHGQVASMHFTAEHAMNLPVLLPLLVIALLPAFSRCAGKRWSAIALEERRGRIRVGNDIYPVTIAAVRAPAALDRAWRAGARERAAMAHGGVEELEPRPDHWWSFRLARKPGPFQAPIS